MIFAAQVDQATGTIKQGLGFSSTQAAQAHFEANPEFVYISTDVFVSPETHQFINGQIVPV